MIDLRRTRFDATLQGLPAVVLLGMLTAIVAGFALRRHFDEGARNSLTRQAILRGVEPWLAERKRRRGEDFRMFVDRARDSAALGRLWYDPGRHPQVRSVSARGFGHRVVARIETEDNQTRYFELAYSPLDGAWKCSESWENGGLVHPERDGFGLLGRFFPRSLHGEESTGR